LATNLNTLSKNQLKSKKAYHKRLDKPAAQAKQVEESKDESKSKKVNSPTAGILASECRAKVGGSKNGETRQVPSQKAPKYYPAEDVHLPKKSRKTAIPTPALKKRIQPGSVLILLAGQFRGKRVVFLKQLKSGLLLVTGPYKLNSVPLRRVNQAYVIATSTVVDLGDLKVRFGSRFLWSVRALTRRSTTSSTTHTSSAPRPRLARAPRLRSSRTSRSFPSGVIDNKLIQLCAENPPRPTKRRSRPRQQTSAFPSYAR
jgi:hypothetical protein